MMRWSRTAWRVILALLAFGGVAGALLLLTLQPWTANHFSYALPGPRGLPYRLSYAGRHYANAQTCAGASWCGQPGIPDCTTAASLRGYGYWPLRRVGTVFTLFGPSRPLLRAPTPNGMTTMALYVPMGRDCYAAYGLEGGP